MGCAADSEGLRVAFGRDSGILKNIVHADVAQDKKVVINLEGEAPAVDYAGLQDSGQAHPLSQSLQSFVTLSKQHTAKPD